MSNTIIMKLTAAVVLGGKVQVPGALVEVSVDEARNLARRGKAVPATASDHPFAGATDENPTVATLDAGSGQLVDVHVVGQDPDGTPVIDQASGETVAKALRAAAVQAREAATAAAVIADSKAGKNVATKRREADAATAAAEAANAAEKAADDAEAALTATNTETN